MSHPPSPPSSLSSDSLQSLLLVQNSDDDCRTPESFFDVADPFAMQEKPSFFQNLRVYVLAVVAFMGSFLFGYDTGVMASVLTFPSFKNDFGVGSGAGTPFASAHVAEVSSNVVSLLTAGCFFGALAAPFAAEWVGRRIALMIFSSVFLLGGALQVAATPGDLSYIYAERVVAGLGVGAMSSITPVYVSENAPAKVRGRITGLFQLILGIGGTTAQWTGYGCSIHIDPTSSMQWRIPVGIQLIPGGILLIGMFFLKESPRWLVKKGRHREAIESLSYMRRLRKHDVIAEYGEIKISVEEEFRTTAGVTWREVLKPSIRSRFIVAFMIMLCQQFTGTNAIGYYAPQLFQTVGLNSPNLSIMVTGIKSATTLVVIAIFLLVGVDKIGRRKPLLIGAVGLAATMFIMGAVLATHPPQRGPDVAPSAIAIIAMIYCFAIIFAVSWGPVAWIYISEIFPTRVRTYGVAVGSASQWLFNFVVTKFTPEAINRIGWRMFIMFGVFCLGVEVFAIFCIKETKGLTLEQMDVLFGTTDADERRAAIENAIAQEQSAAAMLSDARHAKHPSAVEDKEK